MATRTITIEYKAELDKYKRQMEGLIKGNEQLQKEVDNVNGELEKLKNRQRETTSAASKLTRGIKSTVAGFVGWAVVIGTVIRALNQGIRTIKEFDQAQANLAAITGQSRKEIQDLTKDAQELAAVTKFTASEVTELQTELAKLGFSTDDILELTGAVLELAAASGTTLAEAAVVAGQTVRGFGLEAEEVQRVVDVMAKSFTTSALDMQKFSVAMATVAPVAANAGASIEQTTALLGTLVDAGLDASTAGTSLRNIFLRLAQSGMTWAQAMEEIQTATDKNATSLQLFGIRASTAATLIAENTEKIDEMEEAMERAGGTAQRMAEEQMDTLTGATQRLQSSWEAFILSLDQGEGALSSGLLGLTEWRIQLNQLGIAFNEGNLSLLEYLFALQSWRPGLRAAALETAEARKEAEALDEIQLRLALSIRRYGEELNRVLTPTTAVTDRIDILTEYLGYLNEESQEYADTLAEIERLQRILPEQVEENTETVEKNRNTIGFLKDELGRLRGELEKATIGSGEFKAIQEEMIEVQERLDQATGKAAEEAEKARKEFEKWRLELEKTVETAGKDYIDWLDEMIQKEEALRRALENDTIRIESLDLGDDLSDPETAELVAREEAAARQKVRDEEAAQLKAEREQRLRNDISFAANTASQVAGIWAEQNRNRTAAELQELERRKNAGILTEEEYDRERARIQRENAEREKKLRKFEAVLSVAAGIAAAIPNPALIALASALGAAQIAAIDSQPIPSFGSGGEIGGLLHSQGGTLINAEKGEFMLRRKAYKKHGALARALNADNEAQIGQVLANNYIETAASEMLAQAIKGSGASMVKTMKKQHALDRDLTLALHGRRQTLGRTNRDWYAQN